MSNSSRSAGGTVSTTRFGRASGDVALSVAVTPSTISGGSSQRRGRSMSYPLMMHWARSAGASRAAGTAGVAPTTRSRAVATSIPQSRHAARNRPIGNRSVPCSSKCRRYPSAASCSTASRWRASSWSSRESGSIAVIARLASSARGRSSAHHCAARARHGRVSSVRVALRSHRRIAGTMRASSQMRGAGTERDESGPASGTGCRYG